MNILSFRTPLFAAFFLASFFFAALLTGCNQDKNAKPVIATSCPGSTTPIASIQGSAPKSNMIGELVGVQGIITLMTSNDGFYIEEPGSDEDDRTSNAIFLDDVVFDKDIDTASIVSGTRVQVRGNVAELDRGRNSLTALVNTEVLAVCGGQQALPQTSIALPLKGLDREAIEGMRVNLPQSLTIIDNYRLSKGQIGVSGKGFQYTATELIPPGVKTNEVARENQAMTLPVQLFRVEGNVQAYAAGSSIDNIIGVMAHDDRELRLTLSNDVLPLPAMGVAVTAPAATTNPADSRVVSMNLYNYFNGNGAGGDFPTPRGAKTFEDFQQQRQRIGAAVHVLQPQLVAVMELENDGFGPDSATADFIALLNQEVGGSWTAARPDNDNTGSDAIKVGIFYRSDLWQAQGSARTLSGPEFERSRQPLAQVFNPIGGGEWILLVVNHFKSKGSCPDSGPDSDPDANQKDGQGCWSSMRTRSANIMTAWVNSLAATSQTDNILIMGDLNAYRQEDPITAIRAAGFTELLDSAGEQPFSYIYYGQAGTLDYAFASPALIQNVQNAFIWQVNSTMPASLPLPQPWLRFSDHDPVVVDLSLRH